MPKVTEKTQQALIKAFTGRAQGKSNAFHFHREALRAKYGDPRVSLSGGIKREYFELEDGQVIMFASPTPENSE